MTHTKKYCSHGNYNIIYDMQLNSFSIFNRKTPLVTEAHVEGIDLSAYADCNISYKRSQTKDESLLTVVYSSSADASAALTLLFRVGYEGICIEAVSPETEPITITGRIPFAPETIDNVFPVCLDRNAKDFRSAIGKAISPVDNALYNKMTDTALVVGASKQTCLKFDKLTGQYQFTFTISPSYIWKDACISLQENVLANKYHIDFSPINKHATFPTAPVGWMTWYAVKFDACEEKVLTNAKWQAENLKDYGANTVWVDWEWYHNTFNYERTDGVNSLHPDPVKYPHGMKYVADQIREMGLIPSLWIGYANEPCKNEYMEKYPDMILADEMAWCGKYYLDFSNPHYLNEYLPAAVKNVHDWGYEAVKYDTLPSAISIHERHHMNMYDPTLTTREAYRNMIKRTRELLGEDVYMLSCSGSTSNAVVLWACDMFDAARIGEDIFSWEDYLKNCVERLQIFYPLHNIQFYNDPDNVVLREEFNTFEQAKSRVSLVSLLGLPMTFGDEFSDLSEDRIDLLKRSLPILDIHPMDLCSPALDKDSLLINLNIAADQEAYQITGAFNMTEQSASRTLDCTDDLHLEKGKYLVYDFYRDTFLGEITDNLQLDFVPYECRILSLRPSLGIPQIISTSRHITQGAAEIMDMQFAANTLQFTAALVANDRYTVSLYVPAGYEMTSSAGFESYTMDGNLLRLTFLPAETGEYHFKINFAAK